MKKATIFFWMEEKMEEKIQGGMQYVEYSQTYL